MGGARTQEAMRAQESARGTAGGRTGTGQGVAQAPATASARGQSAEAQGGSATCTTAPTRTVAIPPVANLSAIPDPVARNQAINQSYHAFDTAMSSYLGVPLVANWCTFGQHASREAGEQIRNLQAGLAILDDSLQILTTVALNGGSPMAALGEVSRVIRTVERIVGLASQQTLLAQSMQLAMANAGITIAELNGVVSAAQTVLAYNWTHMIPGVQAAELIQFLATLAPIVAKLVVAIPAILTSVRRVYENMKQGNREIYDNIAPAYASFLTAANGAPNNIPGAVAVAGDRQGFVAAAFVEYGHVRRLADEILCEPGTPASQAKTAERAQKAHRANLLIGFQEQLVILQPIFDTMQQELAAMAGTMSLRDPNGVHPLIANWGDFYTRMGIDPATAPRDPRTITPATLPPVLRPGQPNYAGTINQYFSDGLTNAPVHGAPRGITSM